MFWSSPSAGLEIFIFLMIASFVISLIIYLFSKKLLLSLFIFSVLGNMLTRAGIDYRIAMSYDIIWLWKSSFYIWPAINILLLFFLIFNSIKKRNKNEK